MVGDEDLRCGDTATAKNETESSRIPADRQTRGQCGGPASLTSPRWMAPVH